MPTASVIVGDCRLVLPLFPDNTFDALVTDPPYGLKFMGRGWDHSVPGVEFWAEFLRVAKPGAHLLAFGGTRTFHRMACAIEDAGWELRDTIMWLYGSGFPKSHNVALSIDKQCGHGDRGHRIAVASRRHPDGTLEPDGENLPAYSARSFEAAGWEGWGTALKPAFEPIILARKPLIGTVAANVLRHGTGALNIDACRVELNGDYKSKPNGRPSQTGLGDNYDPANANKADTVGRWPANIIHDGSDEVLAAFPDARGQIAAASTSDTQRAGQNTYGTMRRVPPARGTRPGGFGNVGADDPESAPNGPLYNDSGSAARFFYSAKSSKADRNSNCEGMEAKKVHGPSGDGRCWDIPGSKSTPRANNHPTVKPEALMRYLCRLVTPAGGTILDPFAGSGSTGKAAQLEGFDSVLIEMDAGYAAIAEARSA